MKLKVIVAAMTFFMLVPVLSAAEDVVLIGNPSVQESTLSKKDVGKIFLGKKIVWDDKSRIVITLQKNPATHNAFLKKYIRKSPSRFAGLWKRQIFTGKVIEPKTFESDKEVVQYVSETKGALGYVSAKTNLENVKKISVK